MIFRIAAYSIILMFSPIGKGLGQQLFVDKKNEVDITKKALDQIYNFQFDEAEINIMNLEKQVDKHPGLDLLKSLLLYWKYLPLRTGSDAYKQYEEYLFSTAKLAEDQLKKNNKDVEGIFFSLAAYANLASYYADDGSTMKAVNYARKAYSPLKKGFDLKDEYTEFYFTTGLYNYYREKYPERKPVYRPFLWFFESGNKQLGIEQLIFASKHSLFTKTEASFYLFHIYLRYEKNPEKALIYSKKLHELYPNNLLFVAFHTEALMFNKKFKEAESLIERLNESDNSFYKIPGNIFLAMLNEKHLNKLKEAEAQYQKALDLAYADNFELSYYKSLAWLGLARIADRNGDKAKAKEYYNKCVKLSSYDIVMDEAKAYKP